MPKKRYLRHTVLLETFQAYLPLNIHLAGLFKTDKMNKKDKKNSEETFTNPIDKDKITETPSILEYAHHVGSALIKPEDRGKIKGRAMSAMVQQTDKQLEQIHEQMQLLAQQAKSIKNKIDLSVKIYEAEMRFEPLVGHTYYLYKKPDSKYLLSMLSPEEWGKSCPHDFIAKATLQADYTWDITDIDENNFD